jgi:hypothetical protein
MISARRAERELGWPGSVAAREFAEVLRVVCLSSRTGRVGSTSARCSHYRSILLVVAALYAAACMTAPAHGDAE